MAFPDNIVNVVQAEECNEEEQILALRQGNKKKFCRLHGEGEHFTNECEIVKLVEEKGWKRTSAYINNGARKTTNKKNFS